MDAAAWDDRYAATDLVWSAEPNVWVRELCAPMAPGRALDVAAGEGRNALWLVEQGWTVTATDFSPVAVTRIREIAERRLPPDLRLRLDALVGDATTAWPSPPSYDLVLFSYLHLPPAQWVRAVAAGIDAATGGGAVVVVAHARRNLAEGVGGPQDATVLLDPDDVVASVAGLPVVVERAEIREREVVGAPQPALDTIAVLRRT